MTQMDGQRAQQYYDPSISVVIPARSLAGPAPLSFEQEQLWFLAQLMPDSPAYNESLTIGFQGSLDVTAFEQGLNEFINRHQIWRTSFPTVDGQPVQVIHPASNFKLAEVDLRNLPEAERESEALRLAAEDIMRPFDLAHGPLLRAMLVRLGDEDYRLFMALHHIIFDAVSLNHIFLPELHALYEAFSRGKPSPLSPLPLQYADFAAWEREALQQDLFAQHLAYWKQQLADAPQILDLPTDRPRPPIQSYRGSMQTFALPRHLTEALKTLSRRECVTLYMTLAAAFQALLHRYTGQNDLLIGTITSSRKRPEVQRLAEYFLNTVVLRTDMSGNPTFRELLKRVCNVIISAHCHEDIPFGYIVKELRPERNRSYHPFVQVVLSYQPQLPAPPSGWNVSQMDVQRHISKFDLCLELDERAEGLIGRFIYNTELFEADRINRLVGHLEVLLTAIVADPDQHVADLPLLTEAERQQLLVDWNATLAPYPSDRCIHELFEAQVEHTPDAVAVVFEGKHLTYHQLNSKTNQLAHHLQALGVGPEVLVGICLERSLEMIIGLLGILKAGGAYVPLDPTYPSERLAFMLEDAQVAVLVTQRSLLAQLPYHGDAVVCMDADKATLTQQSTMNLTSVVSPDNLAYVIYTSGSTGRPKGVQVLQRAVVNFMLSMKEQPGLTAEDTFLAVTTLSFDIAALELFLPLIVGARLIIANRDVAKSGTALAETLTRTGTTVMQATPITWRMLLAEGWQGSEKLRALCGGEALPLELAHQLLSKVASLYNMYGPTETTIWSCVYEIKQDHTSISIGRPIANTQLYLLDKQLQPVPVGVPGELFIGGDGLARGYLNRPELTAERFIPHPFSTESGARLYRTGDLARYCSDGTIEHLGRLDFQVKMRGFRIELGEIEAVLSQHPAVRQAVVLVREDVPGDQRLVAYVVPHSDTTLATSNLRQFLKEKLPDYMLPSAFVLLEVLATTPNGKIDRRALPTPTLIKLTEEETFVAPKLLIHQQLVQIWEELLDVRPIGIRDNFFYIGGHSLLAARLVDRIEHVIGKRIALSTLFSGPTIEQLTDALQQQENARTSLMPVQIGGSKRPFFFLHGDWTGGAFYCFALARALGPDQPFYVLEPYKFGGLEALPSLETLAAAHIESMRAIQPEGPYLLGGFCNGGLLAYEMAWQLQAAGERVDFLALINPSSPVQLKAMHVVGSRVGKLLGLGADKQANLFLRVRHALRHVYRYLHPSSSRVVDFDKLLAIDPGLNAMFPPVEALHNDYIGVFTWMASRYEPGICPGKITFYWANDEAPIEKSWRPVTKAKDSKDVEKHPIPGTHMSCVTEHIQDLAECLSSCMSSIQEEALSQKV